jgi:anti-sigma-K factor RskA
MSTTPEDTDPDIRYAEYVLGVQDADTRAALARELEGSPAAAAAVAAWERRLAPLADEVPPVAPPAYLWPRIEDALGLRRTPAAGRAPPTGLWHNLALWHWIGIGASLATAALLVVLLTPPRAPPSAPPPVAAPAGYLVSALQQDSGTTGWTATVDLGRGRLVVVPATATAFAPGRAPELWLIPAGQKPIALGMIAPDHPTTLTLPAATLAQLAATGLLAVSVEPPGGSPTGQPTGPVIAKGAITALPATASLPAAVASLDGRPSATRG